MRTAARYTLSFCVGAGMVSAIISPVLMLIWLAL